VCVSVAFASGVGTSANLFRVAANCMGVLLLPLVLRLYDGTQGFRQRRWQAGAAGCAVLAASLIVVMGSQYLFPHRRGSYASQTYLTSNRYLRHVRIEGDLGEAIDLLQSRLSDAAFDVSRDRLVAYPDLPGLVALTGAKAFGNPWYYSGLERVDELNCGFVAGGDAGSASRVYMILGRELPGALRKCLSEALAERPESLTQPLGHIYHYGNMSNYALVLRGPYSAVSDAGSRELGDDFEGTPR